MKKIKTLFKNIIFLCNYELYQHSGRHIEHDVQTTDVAMIKNIKDKSPKK